MTAVLDAWAVLHLLSGEGAGARRVARVLGERPVMSWVNLGEVTYVTARRHGRAAADAVVRDLRPHLRLEPASDERALAAAHLKAEHGCPYVDAYAAATAIAHDAVLMTGDPDLLVAGAPWRWEDLRG